MVLTNALPAPVTVRSVEVRGAAGAPLVQLAGESLRTAMSLVTSPDVPAETLPPSAVGVVWLDLSHQ